MTKTSPGKNRALRRVREPKPTFKLVRGGCQWTCATCKNTLWFDTVALARAWAASHRCPFLK